MAGMAEYGLLDPTCQPFHVQKWAQTGQAVGSAIDGAGCGVRYRRGRLWGQV